MLGIYNNRKPFYNKTMMDYCRKSTEQSIQRIVEREKERNIPKVKIDFKINNSQLLSNTNNSGVAFFVILSASSLLYYFLNTKQ